VTADWPPAPVHLPGGEAMNCKQCNAPLIEGARFCSICGAAVELPAAASPSREPPTVSWQGAQPPAGGPGGAGWQAGQPVPDWGQELARLWGRVGSGELLAAAILAALALIFGVVGLQMALAGEAFSSTEFHGAIWLGLSTVLVVAAIGWAAAARSKLRERGFWSPGTDLIVAVGTAVLAVAFGFVALGVSLSFTLASARTFSTLNVSAWETFAQLWAFIALGWLVVVKPLDRRTSQVVAVVGGVLALLLSAIGLSSGLGNTVEDFVHGSGWLSLAAVCATLATGSLFGYPRPE
jgi:hypothetical protein